MIPIIPISLSYSHLFFSSRTDTNENDDGFFSSREAQSTWTSWDGCILRLQLHWVLLVTQPLGSHLWSVSESWSPIFGLFWKLLTQSGVTERGTQVRPLGYSCACTIHEFSDLIRHSEHSSIVHPTCVFISTFLKWGSCPMGASVLLRWANESIREI